VPTFSREGGREAVRRPAFRLDEELVSGLLRQVVVEGVLVVAGNLARGVVLNELRFDELPERE
jgi:hypothetical protein